MNGIESVFPQTDSHSHQEPSIQRLVGSSSFDNLEIKEQEFCGDSIDRELVRDLLIDKYKLQFSK